MKKSHGDSKIEELKKEGCLNTRWRKVKDELFQEKDFFDPMDLVQVKYEMLRRVHKEGQTVTQTADAFGFSRLSFYQTQRAFEETGLPGLVPRKRGPRGAHKLTDEVMAFVEQAAGADKSLSTRNLAEMVEKRFGVIVHPRSIERRRTRAEKKQR